MKPIKSEDAGTSAIHIHLAALRFFLIQQGMSEKHICQHSIHIEHICEPGQKEFPPERVYGYYDSWTRTVSLFTHRDAIPIRLNTTLVHEFRHAMQEIDDAEF